MPAFANSTSYVVQPPILSYVDVKLHWADAWKFVPYLQAIRCKTCLAPEMDSAELMYRTGRIKRENSLTSDFFTPLQLRNYYVRIRLQYPGNAPVVVWTGIIIIDQIGYARGDYASGDQILQCYGLGSLLNRHQVTRAFTDQDDSGELKPIEWTPYFNMQNHKGETVIGNMSKDGTTDDNDILTHYFSTDLTHGRKKWNNLQIIQYLLSETTDFAPDAMLWVVTGSAKSALENIEDVYNIEGQTVWQALQNLIDHKRGLCFYINPLANGTIQLEVNSVTDTAINIGGKALPANTKPCNFNIPTSYPEDHITDEIRFETTAANMYSEIIVRSSRIRVMCTWSYKDMTLEEGFTTVQSDDYLEATGLQDEIKNDLYRQAPKFDQVFVDHVIPKEWNWQVGESQILGTGPKYIACPIALDDGTVKFIDPADPLFDETKLTFWKNGVRKMQRELPMKVGWDYTTGDAPVNGNFENNDPDFQPLFVAFYDGDNGVNHTADLKWHRINKLHASNSSLDSIQVHALDHKAGIHLGCEVNHYVALNRFEDTGMDAGLESTIKPEIDYKQILVTACIETDVRQNIIYKGFSTEADNKLIIDVDNCEYIYAVKKTIIGIKTDGTLQPISDSAKMRTIRDDSDKLKAVASAAAAWYGKKRQTVQINIKTIGLFVELGSLLNSISTSFTSEQVGTIISSREIDFDACTTTIRTGFLDLDLAKFVSNEKKA